MAIHIYFHTRCEEIARWENFQQFEKFLQQLAEIEGIDLERMHFFGGDKPWNEVVTPFLPLFVGKWREGGFFQEECEMMGKRLLEVAMLWSDEDENKKIISSLAQKVSQIVECGGHLDFAFTH